MLITSRESAFGEIGVARSLAVADLERNEAVEFLLRRTGREGDGDERERTAASELAAELGFLPLALAQAAAYVAETDASFTDYLKAFRKRRVALLERAGGLVPHEGVAVTWAGSSKRSSASRRPRPTFCGSARSWPPTPSHSNSWPRARVSSASGSPKNFPATTMTIRLRWAICCGPWRATGWCGPRGDAHVRHAPSRARNSARRLTKEEARTFIEGVTRALDATFPDASYATWVQCDRLVPHVVAISGWVEAHRLDLAEAGSLLIRAGIYLRGKGRYAEAASLSERGLAIAERALGADHLDVAQGRTVTALGFSSRAATPRRSRCTSARSRFAKLRSAPSISMLPSISRVWAASFATRALCRSGVAGQTRAGDSRSGPAARPSRSCREPREPRGRVRRARAVRPSTGDARARALDLGARPRARRSEDRDHRQQPRRSQRVPGTLR